jgi:hypothetical protein
VDVAHQQPRVDEAGIVLHRRLGVLERALVS